jgi:N,N'-diacetyllegionaminate synthase
MVKSIRRVETALGNGVKKPSNSELKNINIVRKSIVASRPIKAGEIFGPENLAVKRPGTGMSPIYWDLVVGKKSPRDFLLDEQITL